MEVRFFKDRAGHRIAYAVAGRGPLLVFPAWWVSHLEKDVDNPSFRRFLDALGDRFRVVRYDRLGVGLSDRVPRSFTLEAELEHLETLVGQLGLVGAERLHLCGFSCGAPTAVAFAARHPGRVDKIVLFGGYLEGAKIAPDEVKQALAALVRANWGLGSRALRDIFHPGADATSQRAFTTLQREGSDAETAARLLELTYALDASPFVEDVEGPVLVLHRQDDRAIPYAQGRELAARLAGARLMTLEGSVHLPWEGDAKAVVDAIVAFAGQSEPGERRTSTEASESSAPEAELRKDGEVWAVRFGGRRVLVRDAKGVGDLARLLASPGEALHVLEMVGGAPSQSSAEPALDRKALSVYRTRLADLEEALGEEGSEARRAKLEKEREALLHQLAVDTGLGGRSRKLNDPVERARKAVAARVRDAIRRIAKVHPELGAHLDNAVTTGQCCVYRPRDATRWRVSPDAI